MAQVITPETLRAQAAELDELRRRGLAQASRRFHPDDDGELLGTIPTGKGEFRVSFCHPRDRAAMMRCRLWVDEGAGFYPKRGVGYDVLYMDMAEFARFVAMALERSIEHQKVIASRGFDGRRER